MCAAAVNRKMSESLSQYKRRLDIMMSAMWNQYLSDGSEVTWQRYCILRDEREELNDARDNGKTVE